MSVTAIIFSIFISAGSLAWGYHGAGMDGVVRGIGLLGLFWLVSLWRRWRWFSVAGLFLSVLLSAVGVWLGLAIGWMVSGALFALLAWDLTEFRLRLQQLPPREDAKGIERRHLLRVTLLAAAGISIGFLLERLW
ncbi:MAG TPA: hypothetical protein PLF42_14775 [Anaerolineales bacterium]|nr:hypothetical protein [Anaerolineales bacterium]